MSWTDIFPVLSHEMVEQYADLATMEEKLECERWFEVDEIHNPRSNHKHLVATCLFWKRNYLSEGEIPEITRDSMMGAEESGVAGRLAPWEGYVVPLLASARELKKKRDEIAIRVYLAKDLGFLIEDLVSAGCEVYLMKSSSIRHNPGAMWRFLALEDAVCPVTVTDSDRVKWVLADIARTEAAHRVGVGGWRVPYRFADNTAEGYRPMSAAQFGSHHSYPIRGLMQAFVWHNLRGTISTRCILNGLREAEIAGSRWPDYGFDEWFLLAAMYPRMAQEGLLTFFPWDKESPGQFFALDIEYCTWAHPKSELIQYPNPESALGDVIRPWAKWKDEARLKVRPKTTVVRRSRKRIGALQGIFNHAQRDGVERFPHYLGDLASLVAGAGASVAEPWFVDLNPQLYLSSNGGELFLDRRFEDLDVVFCGYYFIKITPEIAEWARMYELDELAWGDGKLLKVPKLEGPTTLWKTEFSRKFHEELVSQVPFVKTEILLKAWMDQGKVAYAETTAKQMGWRVR